MNEGLGQCQIPCSWLLLLFPCKLFKSLETSILKWKLWKLQKKCLKLKNLKQSAQRVTLWTWKEDATKNEEHDIHYHMTKLCHYVKTKQNKLWTLSAAEQRCSLKWACPGRGSKECKGILHSLWRYQRDKKWVEIRGLFLVPPVAAQTDTEQKGYKNHGPERKEREHRREEKQRTLSDDVV